MSSKWILCIFITIVSVISGNGQHISRDTVYQALQATPAFTIYNDNYFITGTTIGETPTSSNSDIKYQVSFKYRLTSTTRPRKAYLYLTYTQLSFWNIYTWSSPFDEINFHPTLGVRKFLFRNDKLLGSLALQVEHESNGRDTTRSRSWNYASLSYTMSVTPNSVLQLKGWVPFFYKRDNPDLIEYVGYGQLFYLWEISKNKLLLDITARKGTSGWRGSVQTQLSYRFLNTGNAYITLQWFQGYAENLIEYRKRSSMLRLGIAIKPPAHFYF